MRISLSMGLLVLVLFCLVVWLPAPVSAQTATPTPFMNTVTVPMINSGVIQFVLGVIALLLVFRVILRLWEMLIPG